MPDTTPTAAPELTEQTPLPLPEAPVAEATPTPEAEPPKPTDEEVLAQELSVMDGVLATVDAPEPEPVVPPEEMEAPEETEAPEPEATEPQAEKPALDEVDAEIATLGLKPEGKSAKRFRELSEKAKVAAALEEPAKNWQTFEGALEEIKATPDQLQAALRIIKAINSGDIALMEHGYSVMTGMTTEMAKRLGKKTDGYDPVAQHDDLRQLAEVGDIPLTVAQELAERRHREAFLANQQRQQSEVTQRQQQQMQAVTYAQQQLNEYGNELARIDPHYTAKAEAVIQQMQPFLDTIPPEQWLTKFKQAYLAQPAPQARPVAVPQAPAPARPGLTHQPLRAGGTVSTGAAKLMKEAPSGLGTETELSVIDYAIELANQRAGAR